MQMGQGMGPSRGVSIALLRRRKMMAGEGLSTCCLPTTPRLIPLGPFRLGMDLFLYSDKATGWG